MNLRSACLLAAVLACPATTSAQEFAWETDLAAARAKAKQEARPLLVVFR